MAKSLHLEWISIAKGIGILLVVVGHYFPSDSPEYWVQIRDVIYTFHMPLFFLISGLLYQNSKYTYIELIGTKVRRLLYPFFSVALIFLILKLIAGFFVKLDSSVSASSILNLIIDPVHSYMPLLWFVWTLFLIFIIYPLVRIVINNNYVLLVISILLMLVTEQELLGINKLINNFPYFILGVLIKEKGFAVTLSQRGRIGITLATTILFVALLTVFEKLHYEVQSQAFWISRLVGLALGISGAYLVINISKILDMSNSLRVKSVFASLGAFSMSIYLFHTFFESGVRITGIQVLHLDSSYFLLLALTAIGAGTYAPLLIEKYLLMRFKVTKKLILGMS